MSITVGAAYRNRRFFHPQTVRGGERVGSGIEIKEIEIFASFIINSFSFIMRVIVNFMFSVVGF